MTQPLALVLYEKLLPGSQIVNRLQDLNYRVEVVTDPALLPNAAEQSKPLLVLADLDSTRENVCAALGRLKQNPATEHLPVIASSREQMAVLSECQRINQFIARVPQAQRRTIRIDPVNF